MNLRIIPAPLHGRVDRVISSKSQVHRALICAALAQEDTRLEGVVFSRDVEATCACLRALGAGIEVCQDTLLIHPLSRPLPEEAVLDCGESGSTLRFLLPVAAALGANAAFTGQGKLPSRPLSPLYEEMAAHGVLLSPQGQFPLQISGQLTPGTYSLAGNVSSQFFSGLLLALPLLAGDSEIRILGSLESEPYIRMTMDMLALFGIEIQRTETGYHVPGNQVLHSPGTLRAEGDWSGAAFWLAAGALSGAEVACGGLKPDSAQGDRAILSLLERFGAQLRQEADEIAVQSDNLRGIDIDASQIPDLVPILAVVAAYAQGDTIISPIARLRLKESDRVASVLALLRALGGDAEVDGDRMIVHGHGGLRGGTVDSFGDHRIAMAAAIAATRADDPVTILGAEAVNKSYPGFFAIYTALGGQTEEVSHAL